MDSLALSHIRYFNIRGVNSMRLGLIARADNTGLGHQTWEFYRHMHPAKTLVVDISKLNGNKQYPERYTGLGTSFVHGLPSDQDIDRFLHGLDVVFVAEAPYNYYLYSRARQLGVKVAVQYNYEFLDWFAYPNLPLPDMLIAPSMWNYDKVETFCNDKGIVHMYLHSPVNPFPIKPHFPAQFKKFLHIAGKPAAHDRNGTFTVIEAAKYVKSDVEILVQFQGEQGLGHQRTSTYADYEAALLKHRPENLKMVMGDVQNYGELYDEGDVLILPRRYGGNCLQLNEALAARMPVIMPDISPNNVFLPENWLVPATKVSEFKPRMVVDIYGVDPQVLAAKIDHMAQMNPQEVGREVDTAQEISDSISWHAMAPRYYKALEQLCS